MPESYASKIRAVEAAISSVVFSESSAPVIADIECTAPYFMVDKSPCLIKSRGSRGFYLIDQKRRMTVPERVRSMGVAWERVCALQSILSGPKVGRLMGNAITMEPLAKLAGDFGGQQGVGISEPSPSVASTHRCSIVTAMVADPHHGH
eukprot:4297582-Pyramimonas_sp.AAC.1